MKNNNSKDVLQRGRPSKTADENRLSLMEQFKQELVQAQNQVVALQGAIQGLELLGNLQKETDEVKEPDPTTVNKQE